MATKSTRKLSDQAKPFLKWAGGKRWLVERHSNIFPSFSGRYIEPFLGGGSVFFHLQPRSAIIADSNGRLIECYRQVRDNPHELRALLKDFHVRHTRDYYYKTREEFFDGELQRAAQFIYLNRTCFNGLYRVNRRGAFNVPIGSKTKVFDHSETFDRAASSLAAAKIYHSDFQPVIDAAEKGDFVFVDPPYTVKHDLNGFLKYNEKIFSWDDQIRLRDSIVNAAQRGAKILLTNAAHSSVVQLYEGVGTHRLVERTSVLSGRSEARGRVNELLVSVG